jgi:NADH:ubiquinone oxidoreductase subunit
MQQNKFTHFGNFGNRRHSIYNLLNASKHRTPQWKAWMPARNNISVAELSTKRMQKSREISL